MVKIFKGLQNAYKLKIALIAFFILFGIFVSFYKLGNAPLENWDEAWYADITRNMIERKDVVVPYWNEHPLFDKPPLYMWLSIIPVIIFDYQEFAFRFISALSGVITICLVGIFAHKKWGIIPASLTFLTLTLNNVYMWRVRSGNLDALFSLLMVLLFLTVISKIKWRYQILGLLFGLMYLTKASLTFIPLVLVLGYEALGLFTPKIEQIIKVVRSNLIMIAIFVAIVSLWLVPGYLSVGVDFVSYYLFNSDQGILNSFALSNFRLDYWWYMYYALQRRFLIVFIFGAIALLYKLRKDNLLLLSFGMVMVVSLSFVTRSNNWYLVPTMPFWSLIIGYGTYAVMQITNKFIPKVSLPVVVVICLLTVFVSQKTFRENTIPLINASSTQAQKESGIMARDMTREGDKIARLDHLYPTTIYYSKRKVFSSPRELESDAGRKSKLFMGRKELVEDIESGKIKLVVGTKEGVESFLSDNSDLEAEKISVNDAESILKF